MSRAAKKQEEEVPERLAVCKAKKDAKALFNKLDVRKRKSLNMEEFVEGLYAELIQLDNPALDTPITKPQVEALWRTLELNDEGEIKLKEFQERFTKPLVIVRPEDEKKKSRRHRKENDGRASTAKSQASASSPRPGIDAKHGINFCALQDHTKPVGPKKRHAPTTVEMFSIFHICLFDNTTAGARGLYKRLLIAGKDPNDQEPIPGIDEKEGEEVQLPSLSRKYFRRSMATLCQEERDKATEQMTAVPFWACGRDGINDTDIDLLFSLVDRRDRGHVDCDLFSREVVLDKSTATKTKEKKKENKKDNKKENKKEAKVVDDKHKNLSNLAAAYRTREVKHETEHGKNYVFATVKEEKLTDFVNDLILNHQKADGKDILAEPPLAHWTPEEVEEKAVKGSGYGMMLFLPNRTRLRAVIWSEEHTGPVIFCTYVTMYSSRSTSRWLYHCKLMFDNKEIFLPDKMETKVARTYFNGFVVPYDAENMLDFPDWLKYVPNTDSDDDHEYRTLRDATIQ